MRWGGWDVWCVDRTIEPDRNVSRREEISRYRGVGVVRSYTMSAPGRRVRSRERPSNFYAYLRRARTLVSP